MGAYPIQDLNCMTTDIAIGGTPATPGSPGTPAIPGTPGSPGVPATPGTPAIPAVPATPGTAGTPATTVTTAGQFVYSLPTASGSFAMWNGSTNAIINLSPAVTASGYAMACSCWDSSFNAYVAMVNTTTGNVIIYRVSSTGAVIGSYSSLNVTTGSLRNFAGMTYCNGYLFVCRVLNSSSYIDKIAGNLSGGLIGWQTRTGLVVYSSNSVNCISSIGTILGVDHGYQSGPYFATYDSNSLSLGTGAVFLTATSYTGTATNAFSCTVSNGSGAFYIIASTTTNQIRTFNLAGVQVWATSMTGSGAVAHGLVYDSFNNRLMVCGTGGTYGFQPIDPTSGAVLMGNSSYGTTWDSISTDGIGNLILQKNSQASNDVMMVNSTFTAVWGPSTFANAVHYGGSANKIGTISVNPGTPATAGSPGTPAVPATPGTPAIPAVPATPGTPAVPATPGTPAIPGVSTRAVSMLGVSNGEIFRFDTTQKYLLTNGPGALNPSAPTVFSAQNGTKMFFVDGLNYKWYDATTGAVAAWTLTAGSLPRDAMGNGCQLIETWNGRTVLAGLPRDSQNYFMSKVSDPRDFNYGVTPATTTMAIAGNLSPLGLVGAPIQCMIPYVDNTMIFGLSHQIWLLQGDPQNGGAFVIVTDKIGMPFGRPWCKDPNGQIYFLSDRHGVFKITPGALPVRVSQQIEQLIEGISLATSIVRMEWDTQAQGFGLWVTPLSGGQTMNFFWEERVNAWWPDAYANTDFQPNCVKAMDGDSPDTRCIFLGCRDGFIRSVNKKATMDDGLPIASFVYFGPIRTADLDDVTLKALHARLSTLSSPVTFSVYVGNSAEAAFSSQPVMAGTWTAGHNPTTYIRWSGVAVYIRIDCSAPWANEIIQCVYQKNGLVRRRA